VVIELDGDDNDQITFERYDDAALTALGRDNIVANLVNSGLWTALRTRPFSKVPDPQSTPSALFVNLMDSNPLALQPELVAREHSQDLVRGINLLAKLTPGKVYLCRREGSFQGLEKKPLPAMCRWKTLPVRTPPV